MDRTNVPYTDATVVRAIRSGLNASGQPLDPMMPRFELSDEDAKLLVDYLKHLSGNLSPGVTRDTVEFATVITPGVDPARRRTLLAVLQAFVSYNFV